MKISYPKKNMEKISEAEEAKIGDCQCFAGRKHKCLVRLLLIVAIIGICAMGLNWSSKIAYPSKDWQAVFLVNGQVYFGKVTKVSNKTLTLKNIYYLQFITKPLQTSDSGVVTGKEQTQQELTLIKLGNELHGPTDVMIINRDQILLTEKIGKNSKVIDAINKYVSEKNTEDKK